MTTEDIYIKYWRNQMLEQKQKHLEEKQKAREVLNNIKLVLIEEFNVENFFYKVYD